VAVKDRLANPFEKANVMADDVSKKDLQALEQKFNKQIAELKKQAEELKKQAEEQKKEFNKGLDEENKIAVNIRQDLEKKIQALDTRCNELQNGITTLSRAIGDIANKAKAGK
jgi:uncharacterized coiled-coil DUF342 family protein